MNLKYLPILFLTSFFINVNAQSPKNETLFSVDDESVSVSEFIRVYNKNLDLVQDESQKDVDEYLKLFTNYKIKLKEAKALELDKKPTYIRELANYKKQLAKNYITDTKVTEALIKEAYDRISNDVKASHILVKLSEDASPADTLAAYNSIVDYRNRALKEGFENVRKAVHNGQTIYGEDLGYFTGFKMVYKFENAAFNTPVGEISQPFRTTFGYHIVFVQDKRKSRGERTVSHIMLIDKTNDASAEKAEDKIKDIYKKIQQGEPFENLAKQFSDDKNSAPNGGQLRPFSSGQLNSLEFENVAFGLENLGDVSEPFKTSFGWHIVKLIDKKPIAPFEDMKPELEQMVTRDSRSKLIDEALYSKLYTKYKIGENKMVLKYFETILNDSIFSHTWKLPVDFQGDKPLVKIGNKQLYFKDFGDYLLKYQRGLASKSSYANVIDKAYKTYLNNNLIEYQEDNLEFEDEEFANIVSEYRDGLLLFDLMQSTIWSIGSTDSLGLQSYYNNHKANYFYPERLDAVVASSNSEKTIKKVANLLEENKSINDIKSIINSNDKVDVIFTVDTLEVGHQALPKSFDAKKGVSKIYKHHDAFTVVKVNSVIPQEPKTFEQSKGAVISDYQAYKEEEWLNELHKKYALKINDDALMRVKSQLKKK